MKSRQISNRRLKRGIIAEGVLVLALAVLSLGRQKQSNMERTVTDHVLSIENDYIKWVDFTVSYEALCKAYDWDIKTHGTEHEIDWVELLAYTAARTGGEFGKDALKTMEKAAGKLSEGESTMKEMTEDLKYYSYYKEAYDAAIGGLVGEYWAEVPGSDSISEEQGTGATGSVEGEEPGQERKGRAFENTGNNNIPAEEQNGSIENDKNGNYEKRYGLKGYFPLARGFDYTHYDDFGVGRSYGYQRKHLG